MDFAAVEAFLAIVRLGGFTRAAAALHLSQPALSRRIGLLEHELGRPLFERGRKGAQLTDAGNALLPYARAALASLREGAAAVEALARGETGRLTLAIVGTLASTDLTAQLRRFREAHPRLQVALRTGNSTEVSDLVHRGEAMLGLRYTPEPSPDILSETLHHEDLCVVAHAGHRLAGARRVAPEQLRNETWVAFPLRRGAKVDAFSQVIMRTLAAAGLDDCPLVPVDSLTAQKRLVEAGFGLAMVPESGVREELELDTLQRLDVPALRATIEVALIRRRSTVLTPAAQRLVEALRPGPSADALARPPHGGGRAPRAGSSRRRTRRAEVSGRK